MPSPKAKKRKQPKPRVKALTLALVQTIETFLKTHPKLTNSDLIAALDWIELGLFLDNSQDRLR